MRRTIDRSDHVHDWHLASHKSEDDTLTVQVLCGYCKCRYCGGCLERRTLALKPETLAFLAEDPAVRVIDQPTGDAS